MEDARDWGRQFCSVPEGQHSACQIAEKRQHAARFSGSEGITDQSDRIKIVAGAVKFKRPDHSRETNQSITVLERLLMPHTRGGRLVPVNFAFSRRTVERYSGWGVTPIT